MKKTSLSLIALLAATTLSHAQNAPHFQMNPMSLEEADTDKDGAISKDEFDKNTNASFEGSDADKDGKVSALEMGMMIEKMRLEKMSKRMIERFDNNKDGFVSKDELVSKHAEKFEQLDKNKDGKLTQDEMPAKKKDKYKKMDDAPKPQ